MTNLVIRPLTTGEEDLFESLPDPGLVGFAAFGDTYTAMAAAGEYRLDWTWIALRDGAVVARAAWWAGPTDDKPLALDWFDFTDSDAAVQLLRSSPLRAQYSLKLPLAGAKIPRSGRRPGRGSTPLSLRACPRWSSATGTAGRRAAVSHRVRTASNFALSRMTR